MGLFSKECAVCGGTADLLSGKKISDGKICKECVEKLSPWFTDYDGATTESIKNQIAARRENRGKLDNFNVTKAWGVKKYPVATQFIYDGENRNFVVVEGPEETFREKNPDIISFSQVRDVYLEVAEDWSETKDQYAVKKTSAQLLQENYDKVYWRYDFILHIELDHPYLTEISYQMNFKTTVMKVPQRKFMYRRGLEFNGEFRGKEIKEQIARLKSLIESEDGAIDRGKAVDAIIGANDNEPMAEAVVSGIKDDIYLSKIANIIKHVERANRISDLLLA